MSRTYQLEDGEVPVAWVRLLRVHATVTAELNARMGAHHGLSLSAYEVLLFLSWAPDHTLRPSDLSRRVLLTQSGVTRLLADLSARGLIERTRSIHDKRAYLATLTEAGARLLRDAAADHVADVDELFSRYLEADELDHLATLLGHLPGGDIAVGRVHPVRA
jgi:DNA-binding MarR family transcriptional regulator